MPNDVCLTGERLTLEEIVDVAFNRRNVTVDEAARARVVASRRLVEEIVERRDTAYGINTGFGKLSDVSIAPEQLEDLQHNLVRSHACGLGDPLPEPAVRAMLLLRANVLAKGYSGVRPVVIDTLVGMLREGVHPVVPARGSGGGRSAATRPGPARGRGRRATGGRGARAARSVPRPAAGPPARGHAQQALEQLREARLHRRRRRLVGRGGLEL